jgi:hypothetical protein
MLSDTYSNFRNTLNRSPVPSVQARTFSSNLERWVRHPNFGQSSPRLFSERCARPSIRPAAPRQKRSTPAGTTRTTAGVPTEKVVCPRHSSCGARRMQHCCMPSPHVIHFRRSSYFRRGTAHPNRVGWQELQCDLAVFALSPLRMNAATLSWSAFSDASWA